MAEIPVMRFGEDKPPKCYMIEGEIYYPESKIKEQKRVWVLIGFFWCLFLVPATIAFAFGVHAAIDKVVDIVSK